MFHFGEPMSCSLQSNPFQCNMVLTHFGTQSIDKFYILHSIRLRPIVSDARSSQFHLNYPLQFSNLPFSYATFIESNLQIVFAIRKIPMCWASDQCNFGDGIFLLRSKQQSLSKIHMFCVRYSHFNYLLISIIPLMITKLHLKPLHIGL